MRQTCARPTQVGARSAASDAVASRRRVSIRPWLFSMVWAHRTSGGGDHSAEGGSGPEGQGDVGFQCRLIVLHGEEIVATAIFDDTTDFSLGEYGVARDDDVLQRQRLQQLQGGCDF